MRTEFTPIITSLLQTDLYKFTMWQAMLHAHPSTQADYRFVCRNTPKFALSELEAEVNAQLDHLCELRFTEDELGYLAGLRFMKSDFIDFLRVFQFHRPFITVRAVNDKLEIIAKGPQVHVMGFEIFVLAIVNELYFKRFDAASALVEGRKRLAEKIDLLRTLPFDASAPRQANFEFFDFGVRRRFSSEWQDEVVATFKREVPQFFKGTSNVFLAKKYGLVPIGTMAHEWLQTFQALDVRLKDFQKAALEAWVQEYRGDLGVALTDVVGMDAFLADFDLYHAKLFDGLRHDSGDPVVWGEKALAHYKRLRIDPMTKRLVFSDGLDLPKAIELFNYFAGRVQTGFGIGTNLTNDMGIPSLNIVMKLMTCNDEPVAKLSDTPGKTLCEDEIFLAYLRDVFAKVVAKHQASFAV